MGPLHPSLARWLEAAFRAVLEAHGIAVDGVAAQASGFGGGSFAAVMGLSSDKARGTLVVASEAAFLHATHPMRGPVPSLPDALLADWLGELANLAMGGLVRALAEHDVTGRITPPSLERDAATVLAVYAERQPSVSLCFATPAGQLTCQLGLTLEDGVDLGEAA